MSEVELPASWERPSIQDCCELNPRLDKSEIADSKTVHFVPMPAVKALVNKVDISALRAFSDVKKGYTPFKSSDVIFAKITPCMENGKVAVIPALVHGLAFGSTEFHVIRALDELLPLWIFYFISSQAYRYDAEHNMTGAVGQRRVPIDFIAGSAIPLPPIAEQRRIVSKIEELFGELAAGEERFRQTRRQLDAYRQSLLKQAFEGKLTASWRAQHPGLIESPNQLLARIQVEREKLQSLSSKRIKATLPPITAEELRAIPELPFAWTWCRVGESGEVQLGRQRAPKHSIGENMRQYLRVANVFEDRIDTSNVLTMNFAPAEFKTFQLHRNDILLNEGQSLEWVGRPAMFKDELPDCCFQNTLVRYRALPCIEPTYALRLFIYYLKSGRFQKIAKWTNNIAHLGAGRFAEVEFPLCSLPEQQEIVRLLDEQFEAIAQNEQEIDAALKRSEALRQSILKKAFTGQLVPQDPNDEPAAILLERIRAERAAESKTERPIRKRTAIEGPPASLTDFASRPYPVLEMFKRGYFLDRFGSDWPIAKKQKEEMLQSFFHGREAQPVWSLNRQSPKGKKAIDFDAMQAWRCRVLDLAAEQKVSAYDAKTFDPAFIRELAQLSKESKGPLLVTERLRKAGVAVVIEKHFERTYLDGAALRNTDGCPVIALTLRYNRIDNFWFTLFHELGHVLKHFARAGQEDFIDTEMRKRSAKKIEKEADRFALDALIPEFEWPFLQTLTDDFEIQLAAARLGIHPGIIAGRLQREADDYTTHKALLGQGEIRKLFGFLDL